MVYNKTTIARAMRCSTGVGFLEGQRATKRCITYTGNEQCVKQIKAVVCIITPHFSFDPRSVYYPGECLRYP